MKKKQARQTLTMSKSVKLPKSGNTIHLRYLYNEPQNQTSKTHNITTTGMPPAYVRENKIVRVRISDNDLILVAKRNLKKALSLIDIELAKVNNLKSELNQAQHESSESLTEFDEYRNYYDSRRKITALPD